MGSNAWRFDLQRFAEGDGTATAAVAAGEAKATAEGAKEDAAQAQEAAAQAQADAKQARELTWDLWDEAMRYRDAQDARILELEAQVSALTVALLEDVEDATAQPPAGEGAKPPAAASEPKSDQQAAGKEGTTLPPGGGKKTEKRGFLARAFGD